MNKKNRSSTRASQPHTLVTAGGVAVVSLGVTACLLAWLSGESLPLAILTSGAAMAASMNALVAVATFLAGHPRDDEVRGKDGTRKNQAPEPGKTE